MSLSATKSRADTGHLTLMYSILSFTSFSNVSTVAGDHEALDGELDHIKSSLRNTGKLVKEFIQKVKQLFFSFVLIPINTAVGC